MNETILEGMARAFFASAWADQRDEYGQGTGGEIMDQIPATYDPSAWHAARTLYMDMERANDANMSTLYEVSQADLSEREFGHYAAMQAMGHGVGLWEYDSDVRVPGVEFGSYSLERDYFTPRPARKSFNVTYEIVTDESAEHGDADERGYIVEMVSLREAVAYVRGTRTNRVGSGVGTEADCCYPGVPRWITVLNGMEYETGAFESRSLHIPDNVTPASAIRIARYLRAYTYTRKGR